MTARSIDKILKVLKDLELKQNVLEGYAELIHETLEDLKRQIKETD